jgi:hypothetical protein
MAPDCFFSARWEDIMGDHGNGSDDYGEMVGVDHEVLATTLNNLVNADHS